MLITNQSLDKYKKRTIYKCLEL